MQLFKTDRRGFTLVELLVVIVILSIITIATIPIVRPALDTRRIREASRMLAAHVTEAQVRAAETGRPAGIWIERLPNAPTVAMDLYLCEIPPPYAGSDINTQIQLKVEKRQHPANAGIQVDEASVTFQNTDTNWFGLLRPGDLIRFNYSGLWYRFAGDGTDNPKYPLANSLTTDSRGNKILDNSLVKRIQPTSPSDYYVVSNSPLLLAPNFRCLPPAASTTAGWVTTYQIHRQPIKLSTSPLQLPSGTIVDLAYSGTGSNGLFPSGPTTHTQPIIVTFTPSGSLNQIAELGQMPESINSPLYFLVGKREKAVTAPASQDPYITPKYDPSNARETQTENHNFRDLENLWVSINPQTGLVSTAEMVEFSDSVVTGSNDREKLQDALARSRQFATSAQTMGGR